MSGRKLKGAGKANTVSRQKDDEEEKERMLSQQEEEALEKSRYIGHMAILQIA